MTRPAASRLATGILAAAAALGSMVLPVPPAPAHAASQPAAAAPVAAVRGTAHAAEPGSSRTPLQVTVSTLTPAAIPSSGPITLTGTVSNRSTETWTDLNVYLLASPTPITSRADLAEAAATDADTPVGVRRAAEGLYASIGDLPPGGSRLYRLSLSRADLALSGEPGVYWVGVHVLGATDGARDSVADGRARTFMPLLPEPRTPAGAAARTRLALLVPLKQPVRRGGAGRLLGIATWDRSLAPDGRLDRLLAFSGRTRRPLTWVVDPALLDAVSSVAQGNPPLDTTPARNADQPTDAPSPQPSGPASDGAPAPGGGSGADGAEDGEAEEGEEDEGEEDEEADDPSPAVARARAWLEELRRQAPTHTVATVPYGDLDVSAALDDGRRALFSRALRLGAATMAGHGVERSLPVVAPSTGYLSATALSRVGDQAAVLLADAALPPGQNSGQSSGQNSAARRAVVRRPGGPTVVLTDTAAASGGPRPNPRFTALAVRQRVLAEAALHALSPDRDQPLVVSLPDDWDPGNGWRAAGFFAALAPPWLRLVDLGTVTTSGRGPSVTAGPDDDELVYPPAEEAAEVPARNLAATAALTRTGRTFATVLTGEDDVEDDVARVALLGSSMSARADPDLARSTTGQGVDYLRAQMAQVHIVGPRFVMMSGESGPIQLTLVNDLERTVSVGLTTSTPDSRLRLSRVEPITLGPGERTPIRLQARSADIGVHSVTLRVVDVDGRPLGSETRFSVRTSNVSTVIWVVMAVGAALLLLAVVVRLYRRIRRRQATHGPRLSRSQTGDRPPSRRPSQQPEPENSPETSHSSSQRASQDPGQELRA